MLDCPHQNHRRPMWNMARRQSAHDRHQTTLARSPKVGDGGDGESL